jgi:hypothetical protein
LQLPPAAAHARPTEEDDEDDDEEHARTSAAMRKGRSEARMADIDGLMVDRASGRRHLRAARPDIFGR